MQGSVSFVGNGLSLSGGDAAWYVYCVIVAAQQLQRRNFPSLVHAGAESVACRAQWNFSCTKAGLNMVNTLAMEARRELNAVYEVSKTLATSLDVTKTFREALNYLLHAFDWRRAFVVLSEPEGQLRGLCAVGLTQDEQQRLQFRVGEGIVGRVFANGIQVFVPDVRAEPLFLNRTGGADQTPGVAVAMLVTPIRADRHTVGVPVFGSGAFQLAGFQSPRCR